MSGSKTVLEATSIKKSFVGVRALKDANFVLHEGEVCGLVGANGSGKTTFARIVSGLLRPDGGELRLYGEEVDLHAGLDAERYGMAMVHQNLSLIPEMSVWENITLAHEDRSRLGLLDNQRAIARAARALEGINVDLSVHERIKNISPDARQLVEIAKALSRSPRILILDEPTSSLDFHQVEALFATIERLKSAGTAVVFISHRIWEITRICDRLVAFRNGETVGELDFSVEAREEGLIVPLITGEAAQEPVHREELQRQRRANELQLEEPVLAVQDVSLPSGRLSNVSFELRRGEVLGLGGLQGQGQEEILHILAGHLGGFTGALSADGKRVRLKNTRDAIKRGIALIPGDRQGEGLFLGHTVLSNLLYPKVSLHRGRFLLPFAEYRRLAQDAIETVSLLPPDPRLTVSQLSGGNQQKVVLGKWLAMKPSILLLNDPTKGVDVGTREHVYSIISKLTESGMSVVLYASDNQELIDNCDRVLIVFEGRIVRELRGKDICEHELVVASLNVAHTDTGEAETADPSSEEAE